MSSRINLLKNFYLISFGALLILIIGTPIFIQERISIFNE